MCLSAMARHCVVGDVAERLAIPGNQHPALFALHHRDGDGPGKQRLLMVDQPEMAIV